MRRTLTTVDLTITPQAFRAARLQLGLSQRALARRLGVSDWTVVRWETGAAPIRTLTAYAMVGLQAHLLLEKEGGA